MRRVLRKFTHHYRKGGLKGLSGKMIGYVRQWLWSESQWLIYEKRLSGGKSSLRPIVTRRELGFSDLVELRYFKALDFPDSIRLRLDSGNLCHGFFERDQLATIGWSSADYLELDVDVRVACIRSVGLYDFITYAEFKSRGYYTNALAQLIGVMRDKGYEAVRIAVDPDNIPSIKGIERAGFRRTMCVIRRCRFGVREMNMHEL